MRRNKHVVGPAKMAGVAPEHLFGGAIFAEQIGLLVIFTDGPRRHGGATVWVAIKVGRDDFAGRVLWFGAKVLISELGKVL